MGRYDGDYYPEQVPCRAGGHNFAMNGICWHCDRSRKSLIDSAVATLKVLAPNLLAAEEE